MTLEILQLSYLLNQYSQVGPQLLKAFLWFMSDASFSDLLVTKTDFVSLASLCQLLPVTFMCLTLTFL